MTHRECFVILAVYVIRNEYDSSLRNELSNEYHAAAPITFALVSYIKSEIDLLKVAMKRNRDAENSCSKKLKAHNARKVAPSPR